MTHTGNTHTPVKRLTRALAIGVAVFGLSAAALPAAASASAWTGPSDVSHRIGHIAGQVERVADIRNPYRQDARIDRLQARLARLEAITARHYGRLARRNDARIDALQRQLHRMERRAERRIDRRERRRALWWDRGWPRAEHRRHF